MCIPKKMNPTKRYHFLAIRVATVERIPTLNASEGSMEKNPL